ncbi:MAG: DoxX family protein, partial [Gemmatimonadaceae bacterium]
VLFLFAGGMKLVTPGGTLAALAPLPVPFLRFIGTCEVLGALGLILPGLTGVAPVLTPLAAAGLSIIMGGAVAATLVTGGGAAALLPAVVGALTLVVVHSRSSRSN